MDKIQMDIEIEKFDEFLKGLTTEQFDNMLENAGINQISSCEESNKTKIVDKDKLRFKDKQ